MVVALLLAAALLVFPTPAMAYIDPGTGSLIFQAAVAFVLGAGLFLRRSARRIRDRLGGKPADPSPPAPRDEPR
jgi:hypothetical protein